MIRYRYLFLYFVICFSSYSQASSCLDTFQNNSLQNKKNVEFDPEIFKGNDIRGVYSKDFDLNFPKLLGQALISFLKNQLPVSQPKILIAHDARVSGPDLTQVLENTLIQQGAIVSTIGLAPTPLPYFLLHHYDYTATVIVTASHNPVGHNGFKIMVNTKYGKFNIISDLKDLVQNRKFLKNEKPGKKISLNPHQPYIDSLKKEFPNLKPFPFVIDTGNGALGPLAKKVFKSLGLKPIYLFTKPDGRFPNHHPDPTVDTNLADLKKVMSKNNSLFGVGFDGDGDRLVILTSKNKKIQADEFAYMFLPSLLTNPNISKTLIADVKVSNWYYDQAQKMGAKVLMQKTGYSFLRENMIKNQASLAMEFSGHIMFNDRKDRGFDDALYNLLRFIELIGYHGGNIESLLPEVQTVTTNEIRLKLKTLDLLDQALNDIKNYLDKNQESYTDIDGIRITRGEAWGLARISKTEKALSLRFEAPTKKEVLDLIEEFSKVMGVPIPKEKVTLY